MTSALRGVLALLLLLCSSSSSRATTIAEAAFVVYRPGTTVTYTAGSTFQPIELVGKLVRTSRIDHKSNSDRASPSSFSTVMLAAQSSPSSSNRRNPWNYNEGQSPWGLKKNAEIWNGRVAQMAFVVVFVQELIQGKGVVTGLQEGDPLNIACFVGFSVLLLGLTAFLAIQGEDDFVSAELGRKL